MFIGIVVTIVGVSPLSVFAATSPNYQIEEDFIGGAGGIDGSSPNYRSRQTLGAPATGSAASGNFRTESGAGATTPDEPTLSFTIDTTGVNLGSLSTSLTRTGTATFSVLNYTSYGYIVQAIGSPPNNGAYTLNNMAVSGGSVVGTEQFGFNLRANTIPATFGADPQQQPDASFGFGVANADYATANSYKYVPGDVIATATKSSGKTTYTISYIANIGSNTPGGSYSGNQTLVVTGSY